MTAPLPILFPAAHITTATGLIRSSTSNCHRLEAEDQAQPSSWPGLFHTNNDLTAERRFHGLSGCSTR
jgi:hypothetical protein